MDQIEQTRGPEADDGPGAAAGINNVTVLIVLAVLVLMVAAAFWLLPAWFGSSTVVVNARP